MTKNQFFVYLVLVGVVFTFVGCTSFPRYQLITDGHDRKQYQVAGRVLNNFQQPVVGCQVYLTKRWPSPKEGILAKRQHIPVAITDNAGNYSFLFEADDATEFFLYFDAKVQGYKPRYMDITHLFQSDLFQYTGTNPVITNTILIPDKIEIEY